MRLLNGLTAFVLSLVVLTPAPSHAQDVVDGFVSRTFIGTNGASLPYRIFLPETKTRGPLPVVIYLHGSGGAGTDNLQQISGGNISGTHLWTKPQVQARHPAFVIAPQIPSDSAWADKSSELAPYAALVLELLASLATEFAIDSDRVYLVGQSLGGFGTWDLVSKRPDLFAAAIPLCGGGDPTRISGARNVPIWAFHGAKDEAVPVARSRVLVGALRALDSPIKYTEYPEVGHDVWTRAFAERDLPDWLFAQRRVRR